MRMYCESAIKYFEKQMNEKCFSQSIVLPLKLMAWAQTKIFLFQFLFIQLLEIYYSRYQFFESHDMVMTSRATYQ